MNSGYRLIDIQDLKFEKHCLDACFSRGFNSLVNGSVDPVKQLADGDHRNEKIVIAIANKPC
jgi:hypothetical protein